VRVIFSEAVVFVIFPGVVRHAAALNKIKDVFIVLTSRLTDNQIVIPALSRIEIRAKKEFDETKLNLSLYNKNKLKKVFMMEAEFTKD
jgi:hypothetical protein